MTATFGAITEWEADSVPPPPGGVGTRTAVGAAGTGGSCGGGVTWDPKVGGVGDKGGAHGSPKQRGGR